jgi:hypothetical protein
MEEDDMIVFHVEETEYALMKHIMIRHEENQDVKVVLVLIYVFTELKKITVLNVKERLYAVTEKEKVDA